MKLEERLHKPTKERKKITREEFMKAFRDDIDPMHYAGEGFTDEDEIARPADVKNSPYLLARLLKPGYWPTRGMK